MDEVIEAVALEMRRGAGFGDEERIYVSDVIAHWMGNDAIEVVDSMVGRAALVKVAGRYRVMIKSNTFDARFTFAHEFGHWALEVHAGMRFESTVERERAANLFAAVLLAPRALVRRAYSFFGEKHETIAEKLHMSQTATVLRLGEVLGDPRAVVTRSGRTFVRNQSHLLDPVRALRAARGSTPRGLSKTRLRGGIDEGRVALRAV